MYTYLIVDDEMIERKGIRMLLSWMNIRENILEASNGEEALEVFEKEKIDVLLTDINMPFMDGIEFLSRIHEEYPGTETVIFSGYDEFSYAKKAISYGVSAYILKPVNPEEFKKVVGEITEKLAKSEREEKRKDESMEFLREHLLYLMVNGQSRSAMQEGYFPSDKQNIGRLMDGISMFCDDTRDSIKGSVFIAAEGGYVNGKERLSAGILSATDGWLDGKGAYEPRNASQLIPYVSAHDNYTLWDKLKLSDPKRKEDTEPDFDKMDERTLSMNRLAAGIVMTCKGMPFFQAGEEFARTKHGEGNSFKSSWQLNKIDWTRALEQEELVDYYRGLLALRRKFQAYGTCEPDCKKTFFRENQIAGYELEYPDGRAVCVFYNPWEKEALQKLPEGNWKLLCDGKRCAEDGAEMKESMMLPAKSMVLLARE